MKSLSTWLTGLCRFQSVAMACAALVALFSFPQPQARAQGTPDYELPPIDYSARSPSNRITRLEARHANARPNTLTDAAFLRWLLTTNQVPIESQVLVFSKTSLQRDLIQPKQPRSLFFSDDLYIGWVPGGLMEVTVTDPELGLVFYKLDARDPAKPLRFERDGDCLSCHGGSMTRNWPGLMVRSVYPDLRGEPITAAGGFLVTHETPVEDRWGGWYVTGRHGKARHLGNAIAEPVPQGAEIDREAGANVDKLNRFFDTTPYLRAESDIVALMIFEHQVMVHNRLCEGSLRVRKWTHYQRQLQKEMGDPVTTEPTGTALRVIQSETDRILEALLFCDEAALPEGGIQGNPDFQKAFTLNRRPDAQDRSLKDLDLSQRLFRYRCSYMIYSESFASMPADLKRSVYRRLQEILTAETPPPKFKHLPAEERRAIRQILMGSDPEFAAIAKSPETQASN
ncbi:MAG: hypothetical protein IT581_21510 [Verrucomicrobiales bacterium]|nr:hypothetical protein [Verrucomicrobiales bacterium]